MATTYALGESHAGLPHTVTLAFFTGCVRPPESVVTVPASVPVAAELTARSHGSTVNSRVPK